MLLSDQNVEATAYSLPVGTAAAFQASASASGAVQSLVVYLDPSSTATQLVAGVYADNGSGSPGTLLSQGTNTAPVAGAWNPVIISATSLTSGSPYWIALLGTTGGAALVGRNGSGTCVGQTSSSNSTSTTLPSAWAGSATTSCPLSAFADSTQVIFFDNFPAGAAPSPYWVVLDRQGDYTNDELECYLPANVTQTSNGLVETAEVQKYTCGDSTNSPYSHNYTSGAVGWSTLNYTYGTFEAKAEMAGGTGTWPAIWLLGYECENGWNQNAQSNPATCNWPATGSNEIDIVEIKAADFTHPWENVIDPAGSWITCQPTVSNVTTNFHVYDFTWSSSALTWYIDGVQTCKVTNSAYIPSTPMFLIINVAVGGGGGGTPNNSTFPQSSTVQYVKVHH